MNTSAMTPILCLQSQRAPSTQPVATDQTPNGLSDQLQRQSFIKSCDLLRKSSPACWCTAVQKRRVGWLRDCLRTSRPWRGTIGCQVEYAGLCNCYRPMCRQSTLASTGYHFPSQNFNQGHQLTHPFTGHQAQPADPAQPFPQGLAAPCARAL